MTCEKALVETWVSPHTVTQLFINVKQDVVVPEHRP